MIATPGRGGTSPRAAGATGTTLELMDACGVDFGALVSRPEPSGHRRFGFSASGDIPSEGSAGWRGVTNRGGGDYHRSTPRCRDNLDLAADGVESILHAL
jgi:hypothetical protein